MKRIIYNSTRLITITLLITITAAAQQPLQPLSQEKLQNKSFGRFLSPASREGWIEFRNDAPYTATEIFVQQPELLGIRNTVDEMRIFKENTDAVGNRHFKYAQYYNGVRLEGIEQIVHEKKGRVYLINGDFVPGLNLNVVPSISSERAIQKALAAFPADQYLWQVPGQEENFKKKKNDPDATLYPTPELLIVKIGSSAEMQSSNSTLAWRMYIFASKPSIAQYVYVDAHSGEIIKTRPLELHCSAGTAETTFNGTQTVYTKHTTEVCDYTGDEVTSYFTWDDCNTDTEIKSWGIFHGIISDEDFLKCDNDNNWSGVGGSTTKMTVSTLWAVKQAYSYYVNTWDHESFDGSDGLIDAFNGKIFFTDDGDEYCSNANFVNYLDNMNFGAGDDCSPGTTDDFNTIDIVGHEYTHGVIEYAHFDALDYSDESGALNESFADIFGEAVERYAEGTNDWLTGGDKSDGSIRSFIDPNSFNHPDTYLETYWHSPGGSDNGGVHTNSSVQNHIFYMLSQGETGTNDLGWDYNVTGIGFSHAISIAWHAMMNYLDGSDGYEIARNCWIQSAIDLYGSCSQDVISVGQAFSAAGVTYYTPYAKGSICGTYSSGFPTVIDGAEEIRNASVSNNNFLGDCTATINSGTTVTAQSGSVVNLHPGFKATSGCIFTALIVPCEVSDYNPNDLKQTSAEYSPPGSPAAYVGDFFYLYPNPSDEAFTVEFTLNAETVASMYVMDVTGRRVMSIRENELLEAGKQKFEVNTSSLMPAAYLLVMNSSGKTQTQKFIVQH